MQTPVSDTLRQSEILISVIFWLLDAIFSNNSSVTCWRLLRSSCFQNWKSKHRSRQYLQTNDAERQRSFRDKLENILSRMEGGSWLMSGGGGGSRQPSPGGCSSGSSQLASPLRSFTPSFSLSSSAGGGGGVQSCEKSRVSNKYEH